MAPLTNTLAPPTPTPPPAPPVSDLGAGGDPTVAPPTVSPAAPVSTNAETPATGFGQNLSQTTVGTPHPIDQAISELKDLYNNPLESVKKTGKSTVMMPVELAYQLVHHPVDTVTGITGGPEFAEALKRGDIPGMAGAVAGGLVNVGMGEKGLEAAPEAAAHLAETGKTFAKGVAEEGRAALEAKAPEGSIEAGFAKLGGKKIMPKVKPTPSGKFAEVGGMEVKAPTPPSITKDGWITDQGFKENPAGTTHKTAHPLGDTQAGVDAGDVRVATLGTKGDQLHFQARDLTNPATRAKIATAIRNSDANSISMEFTQPGAYKHVADLTPEKATDFLEANGGTSGVAPKPVEPIHPALDAVRQKFGAGDVSDKMKTEPSFIGPDGKVSTIGANTHAGALGSVPEGVQYANDESGRTNFINEANTIRVAPNMSHQAGETMTFTVPKDGVTPEQVDALKQSAGLLKNRGNLIIETADKPAASKSNLDRPEDWQYKGVRDIEPILDKLGVHPNQTVKLNDQYGETGKYLGGAGDTLQTNEKQTALKQPYSVAVTDTGGAEHFEPIDAFSSKDALKVAQKKFPDATDWSIDKTGERTPSTEYSVPTQKMLSMPESSRQPVETTRHELGHALIGQNEGMTQTGMLRHTHGDLPGGVRAAVSWNASDLLKPGTRLIKPEKLDAVIKSYMGGIAADEELNGIHRAANHSFDINVQGSDGNQAYGFLKDAGYSHDAAMDRMHKMIDSGKEYLKKPAVSDIIKENENVREPNLSKQFHYSSERLRNMHEEAQRRMQNGKPDNGAVNGSSTTDSKADVARREGEAARTDRPITEEKITTAEKQTKKEDEDTSFNFGANEKPAAKAAKPPVEPWAQAAADKAKTQGGGFTIDPHTGDAPTKGYQIEVGTENRKTLDHPTNARDIQNFRDANKDLFDKHPELHIGGYGNELNISTNTSDLAAAKKVASKLDQISVWDHAKGEEVMTGGKSAQKNFPDYPLEQRLADLKGEKTPNADTAETQRAATVSTRVPSRKVKGVDVEDHTNQGLTSDMEAAKAAPGYVQKMVNKVQDTPGFKNPEGGDAQKSADAYIRHIADNVKFVHSKMTPEEIARDAKWYPVGAHERVMDVAAKHGYTPTQISGVTAVESPMTDWDANTSLAERTADVWKNQQNTKFSPEMQAAADKITAIPANAKFKPIYDSLKGKTLAELPTVEEQAHWLRLYDEGHNPRDYQTWNPDGTSNGFAKNADGSNKKVGWSFQSHIEKAIRILKDGSPENISQQLGYGHKVRNFYNNMISPDDPRYLTIDTHAVNVGQLRPMSGKHPSVSSNFGTISNGPNGLSGTYSMHDAGYRLAAKELDIPIPSRLQSPVWTKIRDVFTDDFKTKDNLDAIDAIWKDHSDGKLTADQARNKIWDYATAWKSGRDSATAGEVPHSSDAGELSPTSVRGESASGAAGRGNRGGTSSAATDKKLNAQAKSAAQSEAARVAKNKADLDAFTARAKAGRLKEGMTKGISGLAKKK